MVQLHTGSGYRGIAGGALCIAGGLTRGGAM